MSRTYPSDYFWQSETIRLRPVHQDDWQVWYQEATDTDGIRLFNLTVELPVSEEQEKAWAEKYADCKNPDKFTLFSIETLSGDLVGIISLHSEDQKNGKFSMGIRIYRDHRRRGYGTEAGQILLRYGFLERRYHKANSACLAENDASVRWHEKLGFVREGLRRENLYLDGGYVDEILFGMTREEFDRVEEANQPAQLEKAQSCSTS